MKLFNLMSIMKFRIKITAVVRCIIIGLCFNLQLSVFAQTDYFDSLLRLNRYEINLKDGLYSGSGLKFLSEAAANSQFFNVCEEHNVLELNNLSMCLFEMFHNQYNYNYLVLEQGVAISGFYGSTENRGDIEAISEVFRRYPQSPTFATDEELQLIAGVGKISNSPINPIWGVDQDLGALHILEKIIAIAPNEKAKTEAQELADLARYYEMDRINGDTLFMTMVATPDLFADLYDHFLPEVDSEAAFLLGALERSTRIYYNNYLGRKGELTYYESVSERENSMKLRFMEYYRKAQHESETSIKAFVKMGHFHLLRGINNLNVPTFGNFLSEFAITNEMNSFTLSCYVISGPEKWRNIGGPLADAASDGAFTIYDLRPLRKYLNQNKIEELDGYYKKLIFSADAVLVIRDGHTGSYETIKSAVKY